MPNAAILNVVVLANTNQASRSLLRFQGQLSATEASSNKALGAVKTFAKGATIGAGVGLAYAVKKAADFESQLDSLGAVTSATGRDMERFRKQAMKAGADTKFSALDAAVAQTELAKGGLSVRNIMRGGLRSALALAAAGEMDLGEAAASTANAMNLFGLRGKDSIKVADALAQAAITTTADVSDFAMALTQSGGVAKTAGLSFRETVLALEALAKSGVKNSDAGTSLKTSLIQLLAPSAKQKALADKLNISFKDQAGNFKNLSDVSTMLRDKTEGMTRAQRIATFATLAGTDGVRTLTALYDAGAPRLDRWREGLSKSGTAADVAAKKQDNLKGKLENLQGSVETIAISIGSKLLPSLTKAAEGITDVLNDKTLTSGQKFDKLGKMLGDALAAAGPVVAKAAAKLAVIGVRAFFNAFRESPLWVKLLTAGFILSKLGGFSAFRTIGTRAGAAMGTGIGEGVATSAKGGRFGRAAGAFKTIGRNVLGAALLAGVADAATRQGISGFGDRFQQAASTATLGLIPAPKTVEERLKIIADKIRNFRGHLSIGDLIKQDDLDDFSGRERKMLAGLTELRNTASNLFGQNFRLNAKMEFNPEAASKRLRGLALEFDRMRQGAVLNVRQLREITTANFKRIADTMGVNSKEGTQQLRHNFSLGLATIKGFQERGVLTTKGAMREIARLLKSQSGAGKDALKTNMFAARNAIAEAMGGSVKVTDKGAGAIRRIFAQELKLYGLSSKEIGFRLEGREFSGKSGNGLVNKQRGGPINVGAPSGDTVPAMLERGEYVLNRKAVAKAGKRNLDNLNFAGAPRFQAGGIAGMVGAANRVDKAGFPYVYGGAHSTPAPFSPFDCSSAVSYVLQQGGVNIPTMDSSAFMSAGQPGPGKVTVFARGAGTTGHAFMRIGNRYFGTSGTNPGGGAGWFPDPGAAYRSGFMQRHFVSGGGGLGRVPKISVGGPDSALKDVVQGALSKTRAAANRRMQDLMATSIGSGDIGDPGPFAGGADAQANRRLGKKMAARFGWKGAEWTALDKLWTGESGWINQMNQQGSGATGIPQALPGSKMASEGADWATNPATQIRWGLKYIKSVYGDPINAYNTWLARDPHWYQKGGMVGYAGDSLGVGTLPALKGLLDRDVQGHPSSGKTSGWGVGQLIKNAAQHVFDFGTNDATAAAIKSSIGRVDSKTGKKPVHVMTVNGTPAGGQSVELKNKAIRAAAHGDVRLVDWAAKHKGQLDSLGHGAYPERARLIAASIRNATGAEKKDPKESRAGRPFGGPLGKVLTKTLKVLRSSKSAKVRGTRLKQFQKRIRKLDLPKGLDRQLEFLSSSATTLGERADNAALLNVDNEDGTTTLGVLQGKDEGGWLNDQLGVLLGWRNKLVDAVKIVEKRRVEVGKLIERAQKRLAEVAKQIGFAKNVRKQVDHDLTVAKKHPKQNKVQIANLKKLLKRLDDEQKPRVQEQKGLGSILTALGGRRTDLGTAYDDLTGSEGLVRVQGSGGPMGRIMGVPAIGVIPGGDIFDVQLRLRDLATPASATATDSPVTDETQLELLKQLLREANLRTSVSERQFAVLRNFDATSGAPFMGAFAKGGVALVGERGPELAHLPSGTRVHSAADTASMVSPNVAVHIYEGEGRADVFIDDRKIDAAVQRVTRRQARQAGRGLPGRGGGV